VGSRSGAEVESESGKSIFEEFFADPASFSKPGPVDGDTHCGMWCSSMGGGSKVGEWAMMFGNDVQKNFGSDPRNPVSAYSFNGGENLVVQWSGKQSFDAGKFAPTFGGWAKVQLMVVGNILDTLAEKGAYRISPDLGMGDNVHEVFNKMCAPGGADGKKHKYAIPLQWDAMREMGWTGFPREVLLKHYYRGVGEHMELLPHADVTVTECASTSDTQVFANDPPGTCHSKEELEQMLADVDRDLERDRNALTKGPNAPMNQLHYDEVKQVLARPFSERMVNIHTGKQEAGWEAITEDIVDFIKRSLERGSAGSTAQEKARLAKMKPFQRGLLVLKYSCEPAFMDFDGTKAGSFSFERIAVYLTRSETFKGSS